jgi:hypothetical protein
MAWWKAAHFVDSFLPWTAVACIVALVQMSSAFTERVPHDSGQQKCDCVGYAFLPRSLLRGVCVFVCLRFIMNFCRFSRPETKVGPFLPNQPKASLRLCAGFVSQGNGDTRSC